MLYLSTCQDRQLATSPPSRSGGMRAAIECFRHPEPGSGVPQTGPGFPESVPGYTPSLQWTPAVGFP